MLGQHRVKSHGPRKGPWLTVGLATLMGALYLLGQPVFNHLVYARQAAQQGEAWRFLTGHFVHFNVDHLVWDLLAFLILGTVVELGSRRSLLSVLLFSIVGVSVWLWFGAADLGAYSGLSGALTGVVVFAAARQWQRTSNQVFLWVLAGTAAKIMFEMTTHQTLFTNLSDYAVPGAHLAGFLAGALYVCLDHDPNLTRWLTTPPAHKTLSACDEHQEPIFSR